MPNLLKKSSVLLRKSLEDQRKLTQARHVMKILQAIAAQAGLARFASFTYTTKTTGETARYTLQLGFNYRNSLQRSLMELEIDSQIMTGVERLAADELIKSMKASLDGTQSKYTKKDIYQPYKDEDGNTIQGIKVNSNDGSIKVLD